MKPDYILDIETTTDLKTIRLASLYDFRLDTYKDFLDKETFASYMKLSLPLVNCSVGTWFGSRFDMFVLKDVWDIDLWDIFKKNNITHIDGFFLKKILMPESKSFSLANTCEEFDVETKKWDLEEMGYVDKEDFYNNSPVEVLQSYCHDDLKATAQCIDVLSIIAPKPMWEHALQVEQEIARKVENQKRRGMGFDTLKAVALRADISNAMDEKLGVLPDVMIPTPTSERVFPPKKRYKLDGTETVHWLNFKEKFPDYDRDDGDCANPERQLNWDSPKEAKEYLLTLGWKPTLWNYKYVDGKKKQTSPKIIDSEGGLICNNILELAERHPWIHSYIVYNKLRTKHNLLGNNEKGLLQHGEIIKPDADSCGTPTARFRHRTVVNIPRVGSFMGEEFRSLFTSRVGLVMVGWDASSLETVMEAHYTHRFDKEYAKELISGDIHTKNQELLGLRDRDEAKKFKYAITYGAMPPKLAQTFGWSKSKAEQQYDKFWKASQGLQLLKQKLLHEWKKTGKMYITGLDGRPIFIRKESAIINSLFQSGGAILMKHAMIFAEKLLEDYNAAPLLRMHDEEQWECLPAIGTTVGEYGVKSIEMAGEYLNLNVPITGEYKIGENWAQTH
jgi:hypothetical protein